MKLKDNFITQDINNTQMMIDVGSDFHGIVKSNATAAYIINQLKTDTTIDDIVHKMLDKYEVDEDTLRKDIENIIAKLNSIGALQ